MCRKRTHSSRSLWPAVLLLVCACSAATAVLLLEVGRGPASVAEAAEIARLEARAWQQPRDQEALLRLAATYARVGRLAEARRTASVVARRPNSPAAAWLYVGVLAETAGDLEAAASAYGRFGEVAGEAGRRAVAGRLARVRRSLALRAGRRALEGEADGRRAAPDPRVVAVLPLVVEGPEEFAPLGRGLAEMLVTDLGLTGRIRVVERLRLTALLEEMALAEAGYAEPATGARTGLLLGAGRVVQGRLGIFPEERARLSAMVVRPQDGPRIPPEHRVGGDLAELLALETSLAAAIHRELGIELTPAELARLHERPTENVQAFLAYSEGLQALDRGDYGRARERFRAAREVDPAFREAVEGEATAEAAGRAEVEPPTAVVQVAVAAAAGGAVSTQTATQAQGSGQPASAAASGAVSSTISGLTQSVVPAGAAAAAPSASSGDGKASTTTSTATTRNEAHTTAGEGTKVRLQAVRIRVGRPSGSRTPNPSHQ